MQRRAGSAGGKCNHLHLVSILDWNLVKATCLAVTLWFNHNRGQSQISRMSKENLTYIYFRSNYLESRLFRVSSCFLINRFTPISRLYAKIDRSLTSLLPKIQRVRERTSITFALPVTAKIRNGEQFFSFHFQWLPKRFSASVEDRFRPGQTHS